MEEKGLTVADALALRNSGDDGFGFGNGGGWWVIILILFLMSGFGRGFGGYGNGNGNGTDTNTIFVPYGGSNERMVEGIEMTMGAIVNFIESLMDIAETSQEKEIVRKYVDRIKKY